MAVSVSFRTYLLEPLGQIRPIRGRHMFGGLTCFAAKAKPKTQPKTQPKAKIPAKPKARRK